MFKNEFELTSASKLRSINDYNIGFIYNNFLVDENLEYEGYPVE